MAVMRLKSNLKKCSFGKTISLSQEIVDKNDKKHIIRTNSYNNLGEVDINCDFSNINYLTQEEKVKFKQSIELQLIEISEAFARNASKGVYGGRPVIKSNSKDDIKYKHHDGYIAGRKVGEFIGVIADSYQLAKITVTNELKQDQKSLFSDVIDNPEMLQFLMEPLFKEVMQYAATKEGVPHDALSTEQVVELFTVSQKIHYMLHKGFNWPVTDLKLLVDKRIEEWIAEIRNTKEGKIWGSVKKIPVILSEYLSR